MTLRKSVFVIGAGASCEVDFPSGEVLAKQISEMTRVVFNHHDGTEAPVNRAFRDAAYRVFSRLPLNPNAHSLLRDRMLKLSDGIHFAYSIDNYLALHEGDKELVLLGKLAIAFLISECEQKSSLYSDTKNRNVRPKPLPTAKWYGRFFKALTSQCTFNQLPERLRELCVICFNYDRNLEQFLLRATVSLYNVDELTAASALKNLTIWHPYGSLGDLPALTKAGGRPYGPDFQKQWNIEDFLRMAESLRTFSEGVESLEESLVDSVRDQLKAASRIVFLGFGYLPANMEILSKLMPETYSAGHTRPLVIGTCYGVLDYDREQYREDLSNLFNALPNMVLLGGRETTCADLFVEYSRALRFP